MTADNEAWQWIAIIAIVVFGCVMCEAIDRFAPAPIECTERP